MHMPTYRVLSILNVLSATPEGYTLSELTRQTGILTGTISPILKTLVEEGFLERAPMGHKYKIGVQAYYTGVAFLNNNSILEVIKGEMEKLSKECNETCQLGILNGGNVFYLLKVEGNEAIRVVSEVGSSLPAYATALGKAILSKYTKTELLELYPDGFTSLTANTVTDMDVLSEHIKEVRETGFSHEEGESSEQTSCIGVPILQNGAPIAGLSVVFPTFRKSEDSIKIIKDLLLKCKSNIEKILKYNSLV